jgi:hypothetical protein
METIKQLAERLKWSWGRVPTAGELRNAAKNVREALIEYSQAEFDNALRTVGSPVPDADPFPDAKDVIWNEFLEGLYGDINTPDGFNTAKETLRTRLTESLGSTQAAENFISDQEMPSQPGADRVMRHGTEIPRASGWGEELLEVDDPNRRDRYPYGGGPTGEVDDPNRRDQWPYGGGPTGADDTAPSEVFPDVTQPVTEDTKDFQEERRIDLSQTPGGLGQLYREYLGTLPDAPGIIQRRRGAQFTPYKNLFDIGQGLGDIAPEGKFSDFLPTAGNEPGRPTRDHYLTQLARVRDLLSGVEPTNQTQFDYREGLLGNQGAQLGLLQDAFSRDIAPRFRTGAARIGKERFGRAMDVRDLNLGTLGAGGTNPFAQYLSQGTNFAGPDVGTYRAAVGRAATMLGADVGTLTDEQQDFRDMLVNDPQRQYDLALRSRIRDIPFQFRDAFMRRARRDFDEYQRTAGREDQYLTKFQEQDFRFGGRR